jgi:demethylmenaquinone methyltransferase/2-methoxy-6-polyprenyl-1,4-benzoquinol methylase
MAASGTKPPGAKDESQAAHWVQTMFEDVAPRYDFLNHLLSFNIDRSWRTRLLKRVAPILERPGARVLDLCCGTGDVLLELQAASSNTILGGDFCHPMLVSARRKIADRHFSSVVFEGDALSLPVKDASLDLITIAFGFRNLANYRAGLLELHRVLRPSGVLAILEFSHPQGWFIRTGCRIYSGYLLPLVGGLLSGSSTAYRYLPESIARFPKAPALAEMMSEAGFREPRFELLSGGIAALHLGER